MTELLDPHDFDHTHADVSGGWLRAATFGAMDGLVTNTALIAGVGAAAGEHTVLLSGVAGLVAGAFSMALGEFTSVTTANEQIDAEVKVERAAIERNPEAEKAELVRMLMKKGLTEATARDAVEEIHADEDEAVAVHLSNEIGIQPEYLGESFTGWACSIWIVERKKIGNRFFKFYSVKLKLAAKMNCFNAIHFNEYFAFALIESSANRI